MNNNLSNTEPDQVLSVIEDFSTNSEIKRLFESYDSNQINSMLWMCAGAVIDSEDAELWPRITRTEVISLLKSLSELTSVMYVLHNKLNEKRNLS